jgi:hypothetical protein
LDIPCWILDVLLRFFVKDAVHYTAPEVRARLAYALKNNCSMLANVGPLPEGSIHPDDEATLRECGKQIHERGWPRPDEGSVAGGKERQGGGWRPGSGMNQEPRPLGNIG